MIIDSCEGNTGGKITDSCEGNTGGFLLTAVKEILEG